ncbi:uncharacterized protein LOC144664363 isoform X2 [Oculina patagonica]
MALSHDYLLIFACLVPWTQASVPATIYAVAGMPQVQLPCNAINHITSVSPGEIDSFWAKEETRNKELWRMIIVINKDGQVMETFRQPFMGSNTIGNQSYKNWQYYGRVNVTIPYGDLVINDVKSEDAGQFLCHFKNMRTGEHGKATVRLVVFKAPSPTAEMNDTSPGNQTACELDVIGTNSTGHEKKTKETNSTEDAIEKKGSSGTNCTDYEKKTEGNPNEWTGPAFWALFALNVVVLAGVIYSNKFKIYTYFKRTLQDICGGPEAVNARHDEIDIGDVNDNNGAANDVEVIVNPELQC